MERIRFVRNLDNCFLRLRKLKKQEQLYTGVDLWKEAE
jgi:hypothetical protein